MPATPPRSSTTRAKCVAFRLEPLQGLGDVQAVGQLHGWSCRRGDGAMVSEQVTQMHDTDHIV